MPDAEAPVPVTNGTPSPAEPAQVERAKLTRAQQDVADRDAFLAGYPDEEAETVVEKPAQPAPTKKPAKAVEPSPEEEEAADADDEEPDDEDDEDLDDEIEDAVDEEEAAPGKADPSIAQAHAKIRKLETRMRESIARDRSAFDAERKAFVEEWKPKIESAQTFDKLKARAKADPIGVLKQLGVTEADYEEVSKILYGLSPAAAADPKNREAVTRLQRERDLREKIEASDARTAALEERLAKQESDAVQSKKIEQYLGKVAKAVTAETPHTQEMLEAHPKATRVRLDRLAYKMSLKSGDLVEPKKVVRAFEKLEQSRRAMYAPAGTTKAAPAVAGKSKAGAIKVVDKTTQVTDKLKNGGLLPSRADMIERLGKINRGELDPDAD